MSRSPKNPLRPLLEEERQQLMRLSRGQALAASPVARAKAVLAVADGSNYTDAARAAGRQSGDAVAAWVARCNVEGLAAVVPRHGGGHPRDYTPAEREWMLAEARRSPDRERDGTAVWSLSTLQRALRRQGLPQVSTYTIWRVLVDAGLSGQKHRSWCDTGTAQRPRKKGGQTVVVTVTDPDTEAKKNGSSRLTGREASGDGRSGARMKPGRIQRFRNPAPVGNRSVNLPATRMSRSGVGPLNG